MSLLNPSFAQEIQLGQLRQQQQEIYQSPSSVSSASSDTEIIHASSIQLMMQNDNEGNVGNSKENEECPLIVSIESESKEYCRYCYDEVEVDFNCCHCQSQICLTCFLKEVRMTATRGNHQVKCTVCGFHYDTKNVHTCRDYYLWMKKCFIETLLFREDHGEILSAKAVQLVILVMIFMFGYPIVMTILDREIGNQLAQYSGLIGLFDIIGCWFTQKTLYTVMEFKQPLIFAIFVGIHLGRFLYYCATGHVDGDGVLLCTVSLIMMFLYTAEFSIVINARMENYLSQFLKVLIQGKGPFSIDEIINTE